MRAWANVAEISNTKSLQGKLVVRSTSGFPFLLEPGMEVALVPPSLDAPRTAQVVSVEKMSGEKYLVELDTVTDVDTAHILKGRSILIKRSALDAVSDHLSRHPLTGYFVQDVTRGSLGVVEEVKENPYQDLLVVSDGKRVVYIPCVDAFIIETDDEAHSLTVDIPDGLFDLGRDVDNAKGQGA